MKSKEFYQHYKYARNYVGMSHEDAFEWAMQALEEFKKNIKKAKKNL